MVPNIACMQNQCLAIIREDSGQFLVYNDKISMPVQPVQENAVVCLLTYVHMMTACGVDAYQLLHAVQGKNLS
jgi:hypothetical protein